MTDNRTPRESIAAGIASSDASSEAEKAARRRDAAHDPEHDAEADRLHGRTPHEQKRADRIATGWRYEAGLEQQAQLYRDNPAEHDRIFGARGSVALGMYLDGKAAAQAAGLNTSHPTTQEN